MQSLQNSIPVHTCFLLFDGFSNHCLANAVEPLRAANTISGRDLYRWSFASLTGAGVTSSSGLPVTPHAALAEVEGDMLMVMPSYGYLSHSTYSAQTSLRRAARRFAVVAGLDMGSWLMADAGLLEGRRATIHWEEFESFAEAFPQVVAQRSRYIIDGNRITCSGATAAFDLALDLIRSAQGGALALEVAQIFMTRLPETSAPYEGYATDRLVRSALLVMRDTLERPLPIGALARRLGCSQRKLEAHVSRAFGITPQRLYRRLRLSRARKLLAETDLTIAEITVRCGYENASAMSRAYRAEFGMSPTHQRRAAA